MPQQKGAKRAVKVLRRKRKLEEKERQANLRGLDRKLANKEHEHAHK